MLHDRPHSNVNTSIFAGSIVILGELLAGDRLLDTLDLLDYDRLVQ
jgi:hypothetical protein